MKTWIRNLLSDAAGAPCPVRVLFLVGFVLGCVFQAIALAKGGAFSMVDYGSGLAAYLAGGGAGLGAKSWADSRAGSPKS